MMDLGVWCSTMWLTRKMLYASAVKILAFTFMVILALRLGPCAAQDTVEAVLDTSVKFCAFYFSHRNKKCCRITLLGTGFPTWVKDRSHDTRPLKLPWCYKNQWQMFWRCLKRKQQVQTLPLSLCVRREQKWMDDFENAEMWMHR